MRLLDTIANTMEYFFSVLDVLLLYFYSSIFLQQKTMKSYVLLFMFFLATTLIFVITNFNLYSGISTIGALAIIIGYTLIVFKGKITKRIMVSVAYYVFAGVITLFVTSMLQLVTTITVDDMFNNVLIRTMVALLIKCIALIIGVMIHKVFKKNVKHSIKISGLSVFFLVVFIILLLMFDVLYVQKNIDEKTLILVLSLFFVLALALIFMGMFQYFLNKEKSLVIQNRLNEATIKNEFYMQFREHQHEVAKLKHDLNNHMITIKGYLTSFDIEKAIDYIGKLSNSEGLQPFVSTNNDVLNAILNAKISNNKDIDFELQYDDGTYEIESTQLTRILGNVLDNAIDATKAVSDRRFIKVILSENDLFIKIYVLNPFVTQPIVVNNTLLSTKGKYHKGLGLNIVNDTIKNLGGKMSYEYKDKRFKVTILFEKELLTQSN